MKRTALFFGSFNPIHFGHLNVAKAAIQTEIVAEVDFIVSPKNPFKRDLDLLPEQQRLDLVLSVLSSEDQMNCNDRVPLTTTKLYDSYAAPFGYRQFGKHTYSIDGS